MKGMLYGSSVSDLGGIQGYDLSYATHFFNASTKLSFTHVFVVRIFYLLRISITTILRDSTRRKYYAFAVPSAPVLLEAAVGHKGGIDL